MAERRERAVKAGTGSRAKGAVAARSSHEVHVVRTTFKQDGPMAEFHPTIEEDDLFSGLGVEGSDSIVTPRVDPLRLLDLVHENNTLGPCVEAMVVNCEATGWTVEPAPDLPDDRHEEAERRAAEVREALEEPFRGLDMVDLRKALRRDMESCGTGYLELLKNSVGEVVFLNHAPAGRMRAVTLDDPVSVEVEVTRGGRPIKTTMEQSERRWVRSIGGRQIRYYAEVGASRDLDRLTGKWSTGRRVTKRRRANEIVPLRVKPDPRKPYGLPRWYGQLPSVMGSRLAEEFNVAYLQSGGVPPALLLVSGGRLAASAAEAIKNLMQRKGSPQVTIEVIEAFMATGPIDQRSTIKLELERFGAEQLKDSLFEGYDKRCEERVRKSFRLPPLFLGMSEDFSFATAFASYLVAEAQVFRPERAVFDDAMNMHVLPHLSGGADDLVFRSHALSVHDIANRIMALKLLWEAKAIDRIDLVSQVNEHLDMDVPEPDVEKLDAEAAARAPDFVPDGEEREGDGGGPQGAPSNGPTRKGDGIDVEGAIALARTVADAIKRGVGHHTGSVEYQNLVARVADLHPEEQAVYRAELATLAYEDVQADPEGASLLAGCSAATLARWRGLQVSTVQ